MLVAAPRDKCHILSKQTIITDFDSLYPCQMCDHTTYTHQKHHTTQYPIGYFFSKTD